MVLLCRNTVRDFDRWKRVFDSNSEAARAAGLTLTHLWRSVDDDNDVFFMFEVEDRARAEAFMQAPEASASAEESGVIDGEGHFLEIEE